MEATSGGRGKGLVSGLSLAVNLHRALVLQSLTDLPTVSGPLEYPANTTLAINKTMLKVVGRILGSGTSRVESGKGTGQWEAIMENRSACFTIHPYLVWVIVLRALYTPQPVTVPWAAAFSLAGSESATAEELGGGPEPSLGAGSSPAAEPDGTGC